ncbi:BTAD domain-containing putative transcriptional regulator [Micromonospora sp. LOL_014]|uniref:BTAD domain-containing putative transcriptional regulator n=1 Tax=Micromonospora sp. LOL_014 TaxID=3345415 RepID=UPI003A85FCA5
MDTAQTDVELRVLGEVTVRVGGRDIDLGHARQRCVLTALLVDANRLVPTDRLLDRVWGHRQPQRARNALAGYLSRLRQVLAPAEPVRIVRRSGGYLLRVDPALVDLHLFGQLVRRARAGTSAARTGGTSVTVDDPAALLARALSLWRGTPFGTLESAWLDTVRTALAADRLAAQLDLIDLRLAAGRHADLLGELTALAAEHPLDERIAGQLMRALYGAGRQAEALRHYQVVRTRLADELGTDPAAALRQTYHRILTADPALGTATAPPAALPPAPRAAPGQGAVREPAAAKEPAADVPCQLPAAPACFTGRVAALAELDALPIDDQDRTPLAVVAGTAGVGKSSLVLHWAHRAAARFPDGQLYANLHGFDPAGAALDPAEVVRGFLAALGVAPQRMPIGLAAQAARYRSLVAGRRMLIVLDNARDAEQVRPLLPGAPGCVTVVTSRGQLTGLHPGPELTVPAVASLAGVPVPAARRLLAELTRASLVTEHSPGRYVLHDLLRAYAAELADAREPAARRRAATGRLLDHLLHTAYAADRLLYPHRDPILLDCPADGVVVPALADGAAAMRWLVAEHRVLVGAVDLAARDGWDRHAWELAWSLTSYVNLRALWHDQLTVQGAALPSAVRLGDPAAQAHLHRNLGRALTQLNRTDEAAQHLAQALAGFMAVGDRANQAQTNVNFARLRERQGHDAQALEYDLRSLELYRQAGHLTGQARAMNNIAWTWIRLGEPDQARELCRQALAINTELGNRHGAATNWRTAGCAEAAAGAHRPAVDCHERALRLFRAIGDRGGEAETLVDLGDVRYACGEVDPARESWTAALVLMEQAGHPDAAAVRARLARPAAPTHYAGRPDSTATR